MHHHYSDIRDRVSEEPLWFDEHAVPRYVPFAPRETANIYADECCLVLIECQGCGVEFQVAFSQNRMDCYREARWGLLIGDKVSDPDEEALKEAMEEAKLASHAAKGTLHYGDPPNIGCCAAGATMNSVPRRVLEFWAQERGERGWPNWVRKPELESIDLTPDWARLEDEETSLPSAGE